MLNRFKNEMKTLLGFFAILMVFVGLENNSWDLDKYLFGEIIETTAENILVFAGFMLAYFVAEYLITGIVRLVKEDITKIRTEINNRKKVEA